MVYIFKFADKHIFLIFFIILILLLFFILIHDCQDSLLVFAIIIITFDSVNDFMAEHPTGLQGSKSLYFGNY